MLNGLAYLGYLNMQFELLKSLTNSSSSRSLGERRQRRCFQNYERTRHHRRAFLDIVHFSLNICIIYRLQLFSYVVFNKAMHFIEFSSVLMC